VGRKRSEIVIAHAECNNLKGDRTPYEAFGHDASRWTLIEERAKALAKKRQFRKARLLLLKDFEREVLNDESIAEFVDRQMHQTSWIARTVNQWLQSLCSNVFAARGEFTAMLRRAWHLDTVIPEVRLSKNLVVMDTDGRPVTREEFDELRPAWEGHGRLPSRTLDKRLDHRHHLVDALVISLASRRLYQKLARNYKETMERRAAGGRWQREWSVEPPLADIRATALNLVRDCRITHKPDRYPSGALFQDRAYALHRADETGSISLVRRKALSDLLVEKSVEATRKQIETIASPEVRALVMAEFNRRVASGESPEQALARPIDYPAYGTVIRRVRTIRVDVSGDAASSISFTSRSGEHRKALLPDGNAYLELMEVGDKATARVVSLAEAGARRYEPVPRHIRRFCKGDTVTDRKHGDRLVVKQIKTAGGGMLILAPVFETRPVRELKASDGLRKISGASLNRLVLADVLTPRATAGGSPQSRH
jgi:CRISPR-associated endonuclease Csn1